MPSIFIMILVMFALIALVMVAGKKARGGGSRIGFPYVPAKTLFSAAKNGSRFTYICLNQERDQVLRFPHEFMLGPAFVRARRLAMIEGAPTSGMSVPRAMI